MCINFANRICKGPWGEFMGEPVIALLDQVWSSIEDLCSELPTADWKKPTDLPGWNVQDQVSHLCGIESTMLGNAPAPPITEPWPPHVKNAIGALNEAEILARRDRSPEEVLTEFMELTAERLKVLAELEGDALSAPSQGVLGPAPLEEVLAIRVVDCVYHEQDIRRAVGKPGGLESDAAFFVAARMTKALPMIVGKRAGLSEGVSVAIDVTGFKRAAFKINNGRAEPFEGPPNAMITTDMETFLCLTGGRWTPAQTGGRVRVDGDEATAAAVLGSMNVMV